MKKIISFILICSMLLALLTGCSYFDKTGEGGNESGDIETDNTNNQNNEENQKPKGEGTPIDKESNPVKSIIRFLYDKNTDHDMIAYNFGSIVYRIKNHGAQPLEATFNAFDYYYVCGYESTAEDKHLREDIRAERCEWVKFDSEAEITEYYNDAKCVFVFQFNRASSVINLLTEDDTLSVEHFLRYEPKFQEGVNVNPPIVFDETIIYLYGGIFKELEDGTAYYSTSSFYNNFEAVIKFVELYDGKNIYMRTKVDYSDYVVEYDLEGHLNRYYDDFIGVTMVDKFSIRIEGGVHYYSCIKVDDFVRIMKEMD
jgi:hypothetical protein